MVTHNEEPVRELIRILGDDPDRPGLLETPHRVLKSYETLFSGYGVDVESLIKTFDPEDTCESHQEMILLKNIELVSTCEHHMLPFIGKAHVAYIPDGCVIGVSKLARILEAFSRRLQIQERIGDQVTNALMTYLKPLGAACIIEAQHLCMVARGVQKQNSVMVTSSLRGAFKDNLDTRNELMSLIK